MPHSLVSRASLAFFMAGFLAIALVVGVPAAVTADTVVSQLGSDIDGEAGVEEISPGTGVGPGDASGAALAFNDAGSRVAIGARLNDGDSGSDTDNRGHVRVFEWNGSAWAQLGSDIDGLQAGEESGTSVAFNSVGDRVAIGAPRNDDGALNAGTVRVFDWDGSSWNQVGAEIDGGAAAELFGDSVALNSDGDRLAVGAPGAGGSNQGRVRVYDWDGAAWQKVGSDIAGSDEQEIGEAVSLNAAGDRVAVGGYSGIVGATGVARVYEYSASWTQLGSDIAGDVVEDGTGWSVSLNSAGSRIAVGAPYSDANGSDSGLTRVFEYSGSEWSQLGADISGEAAGDEAGWSVSLNGSGSRLAVGARKNDGSGSLAGQTRIFEYSGSAWNQIGPDIDGEAAVDLSGAAVALNLAGDRVAVGAPSNEGDAPEGNVNRGHVRIFSINAAPSPAADVRDEDEPEKSTPGIFLTVTGQPGGDVAGSIVTFGSFAISSQSSLLLTVTPGGSDGPQRVLASTTATRSGHYEGSVRLPAMSAGVHTLSLTAQGVHGELLVLKNRVTVADDRFTAVTPERLQPSLP